MDKKDYETHLYLSYIKFTPIRLEKVKGSFAYGVYTK